MTNGDITWIANYIWGICDDVLRDLYTRGKYRDVVLPMTVLRRLDVVLEGTKQAVLDMKEMLDQAQSGRPGRRLVPSIGTGFLQHFEVHIERPPGTGQPSAAQGRLRSLPRRVFPERAGDPRQLRVPEPDPAAQQEATRLEP